MVEKTRVIEFIEEWIDDPNGGRKGFQEFLTLLSSLENVEIDFVEREGVTYSVRGKHKSQKERPLFVMVDVIEDTPRWLSVCFYAEMTDDPESLGDMVPGGLLGEDGLCFDVEEYATKTIEYIGQRIKNAYAMATK